MAQSQIHQRETEQVRAEQVEQMPVDKSETQLATCQFYKAIQAGRKRDGVKWGMLPLLVHCVFFSSFRSLVLTKRVLVVGQNTLFDHSAWFFTVVFSNQVF